MKVIVKKMIISFFTFIILIYLWASFPWDLYSGTVEDKVGKVDNSESLIERPTTLRVMTWNMAYAYGMNSQGSEAYTPYTEDKYNEHIEGIAKTINSAQADIVLLQEVDFNSSRSFNKNQLIEIAKKTGLSYWAQAESWRANYVPFPFYPLSRQFGSMSSGGGILSRWPIQSNHIQLLSKPTAKAWWYNLFYPYRYFQKVEIKIDEKIISVVNLHLEAFDISSKNDQAEQLVKFVHKSKPDIIGGDFNMLPDGAMKRSGFSNPIDRYENDPTFKTISKMNYKEAVDLAAYQLREDVWFTFPSTRPDRRLDYIFFKNEWTLIQAEVVGGPHTEVSDHLPFKGTFKFFDPEFIRD